MDASTKDALLALLGFLLVLYALGMAFFTWRNADSLYYTIFKPRWRWGIKASRFAALAQVPLHLSLGGSLLSGAFHSKPLSQLFAAILMVSACFSICMFFVDWTSSDEP